MWIDHEIARALETSTPRYRSIEPRMVKEVREFAEQEQPSDRQIGDWICGTVEHVRAHSAQSASVGCLVARPNDQRPNSPLIYAIHGGGLFSGTAKTGLEPVLALASEIGAVAVAVDYRLAPEAQFAEMVEDCVTGLTWSSAHAVELGIDRNRVILWGMSAGGGLAAATSQLLGWRGELPPIRCQVLVGPMLDPRFDSWKNHPGDGVWDATSNQTAWKLATDGMDELDIDRLLPIRTTQSLSASPPTFLDAGSAELFAPEILQFGALLSKAGVPIEAHVWTGGVHNFDALYQEARLSMLARASRSAFVKRWL